MPGAMPDSRTTTPRVAGPAALPPSQPRPAEIDDPSRVKVGDVVQVYDVDTDAFLKSDGFIDPRCWLQQRKAKREDVLESIEESLFIVSVKHVYTMQTRLQNEEEVDFSGVDSIAAATETGKKRQKLRREMEAEAMSNEQETKRSLGTTVAYGQKIQLRHRMSGKFLSLRSHQGSVSGAHAPHDVITSDGSELSWFTFEPRYKVQVSGEPVRYADNLCIASAGVVGQRLHTTSEPFLDPAGDTDNFNLFEVNTYAVGSVWRLSLYTKWEPRGSEFLKGGDVVMLLHKQEELFLSGSVRRISTAGGDGKATPASHVATPASHVATPASHVARSMFQEAELSAVGSKEGDGALQLVADSAECRPFALWRVELADERQGHVLEYGDCFRLRNLLTGRLLGRRSADEGLRLVEGADAELLRAEAVFATEGRMVWGGCFHLRTESRGYVHVIDTATQDASTGTGSPRSALTNYMLSKCSNSKRSGSVLLARAFSASMQQERGQRAAGGQFQLQAVGKVRREDGFAAVPAGGELVSLVEHMVAVKQSMVKCLKVMSHEAEVKESLYDIALLLRVLQDVADKCAPGHPLQGAWKELLQHAGVLELVMHVATEAFAALGQVAQGSMQHQQARLLFGSAQRVLQRAIAGNELNGLTLARSVGELQRQLEFEETQDTAATTLETLLCGNQTLVQSLPDTHTAFFIAALSSPAMQERRHLNLHFLASLCSCKGKGVEHNQDLVRESWLEGAVAARRIPQTVVDEKGVLIQTFPHGPDGAARRTYLEDFVATKSVVPHSPSYDARNPRPARPFETLEEYHALLDLFYSLCMGNNKAARDLIGHPSPHHEPLVSLSALLAGLTDEKLPARLRASFARLLLHVYVARPASDHVPPRSSTHLLHAIDASSGALPSPLFQPGKQYRGFRPLKAAVLSCLHSLRASGAADDGLEEGESAELAVAVAGLCEELLRLGFFSSAEEIQNALLPALLLYLPPKPAPRRHHRAPSSDRLSPSAFRAPAAPASLPLPRQTSLESAPASLPRYSAPASPMAGSLGAGPSQGGYGGEAAPPAGEYSAEVECQLAVCRMLDLICDLRLWVRVPRILAVYKSTMVSNKTNQREDTAKLAEKLRLNYQDDMAKVLSFLSLASAGPEAQQAVRRLLNVMRSPVQPLALLGLRLLIRERTPKLELFRELCNTQVLVDPAAITAYKKCQEHAQGLRELLPVIREDMDRLFTFSSLNRAQMDAAAMERWKRLEKLVMECGALCQCAASSQDEERAAAEKKETVRRANIQSVVLELLLAAAGVLKEHGNRVLLKQATKSGREERSDAFWWLASSVIVPCLKFAQDFATGSRQNQSLLAPHTQLILHFSGLGLHRVIAAITAIYADNLSLCRQLDEGVVAHVVQTIAGSAAVRGGEPYRRGQYLALLRQWVFVQGQPILRNQQNVLKQLVNQGPLRVLPKRPVELESQYSSRAPRGGVARAGGDQELALVLFRGEEGIALRERLMRERMSKDSSGQWRRIEGKQVKESEPDDLIGYYLELLLLMRTLVIEHNPEILTRVRVLLPPTKIRDDVLCQWTHPQGRAHLLQLMRTLYFHDHQKHTLLAEAIWDMVAYLKDEIKKRTQTDPEAFSRYAAPDPDHPLPEQLCRDWAPLLMAAFGTSRVMTRMTEEHRQAACGLVESLVVLLNKCHLLPASAAELLRVVEASGAAGISTAAVLTDAARAHAGSVHRDEERPEASHVNGVNGSRAAGNGVNGAAHVKGMNGADGANGVHANGKGGGARGENGHAVAHDGEGNGVSGGGLGEAEGGGELQQSMDRFAKAWLEAVDPVVEEEAEEGEEEAAEAEGEERGREELLLLCESLQDAPRGGLGGAVGGMSAGRVLRRTSLGGLQLAGPRGPGRRGREVREFSASDAKYLVQLLGQHSHEDASWEHEMIVGLKVLKGLAVTWRESATEEKAPDWLLHGVPSLLVQLMSNQHVGDRVMLCCLELGIALLHGGDDNFQASFFHILQDVHQGAPRLFFALLSRLRRAEAEAKHSKHLLDEALAGRWEGMLLQERSRSMHTLVVQAARADPRGESSHVELVLRLMHLLCEGHNMKLQNFLRHQPKSVRSVDMISATAHYVDAVTHCISPCYVTEVTTAMLAIAEFIQNPCRQNQRVLVDTRLCACANEILELRPEHSFVQVLGLVQSEKEYGRAINRLKAATATALLSLLECVDQSYIPERMLASLDANQLIDNMNQLLPLYNPALLRKLLEQHEEGELQLQRVPKQLSRAVLSSEGGGEAVDADAEMVAEHYYITYITLAEFDSSGLLNRSISPAHIWDLENLRHKVGIIEISRRGVLEKAYFIIPEVCWFLTDASKEKLLRGVDRANLQTQLTGFSEQVDTLYEEMKHQQKLRQRVFLKPFRDTRERREKVFFFNAILINILMLLFYSYECNGSFTCGDNEDLSTYRVRPGYKELLVALIVLQCLFAITRQWWYVVERGIPQINQQILQHRKKPPANRLFAMLVKLPEEQSDPTYRHRRAARSHGGHRLQLQKVQLVKFVYLLCDWNFWGISVMTLSNMLALLLPTEGASLFLLVQLLEVFNHSRVLQNVIRSITYRGNSLLQTGVLALVMYYFFGVIGFVMFPERFRFEKADIMGGRKLEPNNNGARCTSIWKCTLVVLDMGLRKGDIGEAMEEIQWNTSPDAPDQYRIFYRMVYTFFFHVVVTTILMNIIFGIIIDTFAELREKAEEINQEITGRCFICGIERFRFDQMSNGGTGFEEHIKQEHNMWKYLFFLVYLKERDFDDYSGGESFVYSKTLQLIHDPDTHEKVHDVDTGYELKISKPQTDLLWFPQRDAMVLARSKSSSSDQRLMDKLQELQVSTAKLTNQLTSKVDKVLSIVQQGGHARQHDMPPPPRFQPASPFHMSTVTSTTF